MELEVAQQFMCLPNFLLIQKFGKMARPKMDKYLGSVSVKMLGWQKIY